MPAGMWAEVLLIGLLGLLIGSFLNVVIYRMPKMLERQWATECAELGGQTPAQEGSLQSDAATVQMSAMWASDPLA